MRKRKIMDKEKILKMQDKAYYYANKSDRYAQIIRNECQKYFEF